MEPPGCGSGWTHGGESRVLAHTFKCFPNSRWKHLGLLTAVLCYEPPLMSSLAEQ